MNKQQVASMIDEIQHLMETTYVFPEDEIELLKLDEDGRSWIYPEDHPTNKGCYLGTLTQNIDRVFNDALIHHLNMLPMERDGDFTIVTHTIKITTVENTYDIVVDTKTYQPQGTEPVIVKCKLRCISCKENTRKDYEMYIHYLLNQKECMEDDVRSLTSKIHMSIHRLHEIHYRLDTTICQIMDDTHKNELVDYTKQLNNELHQLEEMVLK